MIHNFLNFILIFIIFLFSFSSSFSFEDNGDEDNLIEEVLVFSFDYYGDGSWGIDDVYVSNEIPTISNPNGEFILIIKDANYDVLEEVYFNLISEH
ncbi:MAG: hypothetical protein KC550_06330, partial [Nanoarchaeota archaeon]|nr:hypothetical protein [Nanoarchaeota archaeon]